MSPLSRKLITFVTLGLILNLALVRLTHRAGAVYKDGAAIICEQKRLWARKNLTFEHGKPSVIFMGSSIMLSGLVPDTFDQALSGRVMSYNLALPVLGIGPAYFILKDLVKRGTPPAYVITPIITDNGASGNLFDYYGAQGMGFPDEFISYLIHRQDRTVVFNYLCPMRMHTHELMSYIIHSISGRSDIVERKSRIQNIIDCMIKDRGYYYISEQAVFPDGKLPQGYGIAPNIDLRPVKAPHFIFDADPYVKKFFDLARENHIQVLLIDFIYRQVAGPRYSECPDMYTQITSRYPNVAVTSTSWQRKFLPDEFFSDVGHLNPQGARLFTQMIAKEFDQAFRTN